MLLIEEAHIDENGVAHSQYRIKEDEFFTRGHFPGNPRKKTFPRCVSGIV